MSNHLGLVKDSQFATPIGVGTSAAREVLNFARHQLGNLICDKLLDRRCCEMKGSSHLSAMAGDIE